MADESKKDAAPQRTPVAIAFSTVQNFLDQFTEETLPSQIDKSIMGNVPWGTHGLLIATLKFLGFISDDNAPEPLFTEYVKTDKDGRGPIWKKILETKYSFLVGSVDLSRATTTIVSDKFKAQGIGGDTVRKAITFFLHAAKVAGVQVSPHVKAPRPPQNVKKADKTDAGKKAAKVDQTPDNNNQGGNGGGGGNDKPERLRYEMLIDILNARMTEEEQQAVWTIIRYLKAQEVQS